MLFFQDSESAKLLVRWTKWLAAFCPSLCTEFEFHRGWFCFLRRWACCTVIFFSTRLQRKKKKERKNSKLSKNTSESRIRYSPVVTFEIPLQQPNSTQSTWRSLETYNSQNVVRAAIKMRTPICLIWIANIDHLDTAHQELCYSKKPFGYIKIGCRVRDWTFDFDMSRDRLMVSRLSQRYFTVVAVAVVVESQISFNEEGLSSKAFHSRSFCLFSPTLFNVSFFLKTLGFYLVAFIFSYTNSNDRVETPLLDITTLPYML